MEGVAGRSLPTSGIALANLVSLEYVNTHQSIPFVGFWVVLFKFYGNFKSQVWNLTWKCFIFLPLPPYFLTANERVLPSVHRGVSVSNEARHLLLFWHTAFM